MPKEKPILFSAPMVRALLNTKPGTWPPEPIDSARPFKWQTRRIIKPGKQQDWLTPEALGSVVQMVDRGEGWWAMSVDDRPPGPHGTCPGHIGSVRAPYQPGDILWVRETWGIGARPHPAEGWVDGIEYRADCEGLGEHDLLPLHPIPDGIDVSDIRRGWIPSIHMFRWASRIQLEVMEVRAQRLCDISEEDAKAEGCLPWQFDPMQPTTTGELGSASPYRGGFACLWDDINDERAPWKSNPWIWAYILKRLA